MEQPRSVSYVESEGDVAAFMSQVYLWMTIGLVVTAVAAALVSTNEQLLISIVTSPIIFVLFIAEIALVVVMSLAINRISSAVATMLFLGYSALNGVTLAFIFLAFTETSIYLAFFVTAGTFAAMSAIGYFTKRDLSRLGGLLMMGVIGLLIALVANLFIQSSGLELVISVIGVLIFVGLTAYDSQRLKQMALRGMTDSETERKLAIHGALRLYLDFINLFLFLLQLLGRRR